MLEWAEELQLYVSSGFKFPNVLERAVSVCMVTDLRDFLSQNPGMVPDRIPEMHLVGQTLSAELESSGYKNESIILILFFSRHNYIIAENPQNFPENQTKESRTWLAAWITETERYQDLAPCHAFLLHIMATSLACSRDFKFAVEFGKKSVTNYANLVKNNFDDYYYQYFSALNKMGDRVAWIRIEANRPHTSTTSEDAFIRRTPEARHAIERFYCDFCFSSLIVNIARLQAITDNLFPSADLRLNL